jgi:hypothetical protein
MLVLNTRSNQSVEAAQMKVLRPLLGFTKLDHQMNTGIKEKLHVKIIMEYMRGCKENLKKKRI